MDLASLGFKIDTSDVKKAQDDLDGLNKKGKETQAAAAAVGESWDEQSARLKAMVQQSSLAVQANAKFAESQRSIEERARQAAAALNAQNKAGTDWNKVQEEMNARGQAFIKSAKDAVSTIGLEGAEMERLMARVYPLQARLKALEEDEDRLSKAFKAGQLSAAQYADGMAEIGKRKDVLDDLNTKANTAAGSMHKFSLESAGARRELGVMFGEIAQGNWGNLEGSLATLANRTGLFSAAFSAAGASIAAVALPIAAFGVAAYEETERLDRFNEALRLTGNYSGITAASLDDMAHKIAPSNLELSRTSAILATLASTGRYTSESITQVAQAAIYFGGSAEEAANKAASLFDGTAETAAKANEQYHFMNASLAEQISHYQDIGDAQSANDAAFKAFNVAEKERLDEWKANLSGIPKLWDDAKGSMHKYWVEFESWSGKQYHSFSDQIGLATGTASIDAKIADLEQRQKMARTDSSGHLTNWQGVVNNILGEGFGQKEQSQLDSLYKQRDALRAKYAQQDEASQVSGQADAVLPDFQATLEKYKPVAQKEQEELTKWLADSNKQIAVALQKGDSDLVSKLEAQQADVYEKIKASYAKKDGSQALAGSELTANIQQYKDMLSAANTAFGSYQKNLDTQYKSGLISADDYYGKMKDSVTTSAETQVAEINAEIAVLQKFHGTQQQNVAAQQKIGELQTQAADVQAKASAQIQQLGIQETAEVNKKTAAYKAFADALDQTVADQVAQLNFQTESIGMGQKEIQQTQALMKIDQDRDRQLADLAKKKDLSPANGGLDPDDYNNRVNKINSDSKRLRDSAVASFADQDKARSDWMRGLTAGYADWKDTAIDVSSQVANAVSDSFNTFTDDMVTALNTGKLSFHSFATSVLEDIEKIALKLAEESAVSSILSALHVDLGGGSSAASANYDGVFSALGNVFQGGDISKYSGSIVSSPTMFSGKHLAAFANGGNVMGEAGPEAILPLRRGSDGKLGVQLAGNSKDGASNVNFTQTINIASDGSASTTEQATGDQSAYAKAFSDRMKQISLQTIAQEQRPGGLLWKSRMNK